MHFPPVTQASIPATRSARLFSDIEEDEDFSPLDSLIDDQLRGPLWGKCYSATFHDDNHKHGLRALEYDVEIRVGTDYDGDAPETETFRVWVHVTPMMPLTTIVFLLVGEIRDLLEA